MDYEKKYKEIVGQIKKAYLYAQTDSTKTVLEEILPELKESEDEKVRKEIVRFIQMEVEDEIVGNKWLAWLGKRGGLTIRFFTDEFEWALGRIIAFWNQNHKDGKYDENELMSYIKIRETELVKLFTDNVCKVSLSDCSEEYRKAYYDGYNKCNRDWLKIKDISVDEYNKNAEILLGGQIDQKPAWSEEDEQHIDSLLKRLEGLCRNEFERTRFAINEDKDWLKSLKQRIGG